jgi:hypothetical protein
MKAKIFNAHNHFGQKLKCSFNGFPYIIIISFSLLPLKECSSVKGFKFYSLSSKSELFYLQELVSYIFPLTIDVNSIRLFF